MIVIRRMVDKQRAYTGIFLPGMPAKIFPTSDMEHARILAIYKQERPHEGIINDFSDYALGFDHLPPAFIPTPRPESGVNPSAAAHEDNVAENPGPASPKPGANDLPHSQWLALPNQSD